MSEYCETIAIFLAISAFILWAASRRGYFCFPEKTSPAPRITIYQVFGVFAIYVLTLIVIGTSLAKGLNVLLPHILSYNTLASPAYTPILSSLVQFFSVVLAAYLLYLFCKLQKDRQSMLLLWKNREVKLSSISHDIGFGVLTYLISFPVVALAGELFDFFVFLFFGPQEYEQVAVRFLKMSLGSDVLFFVALFSIVIAAPLLEELLFRGFLQNYLKKYFGRFGAILLSSFCFALFHFSTSQSIGNIPLIASLFTLALFLGFIYERQQSLFASMSLHVTFNVVNVVRVIASS